MQTLSTYIEILNQRFGRFTKFEYIDNNDLYFLISSEVFKNSRIYILFFQDEGNTTPFSSYHVDVAKMDTPVDILSTTGATSMRFEELLPSLALFFAVKTFSKGMQVHVRDVIDARFVDYVWQPCRKLEDGSIEVSNWKDVEFYGIYGKLANGLSECIADCKDATTANDFVEWCRGILLQVQEMKNPDFNSDDAVIAFEQEENPIADYITVSNFMGLTTVRTTYDESWDMLMDVLDKIKSLGVCYGDDGYYLIDVINENLVAISKGGTFAAAVQFIEWFNDKKSNV